LEPKEAQIVIRNAINENMNKEGYVWRSKAYASLSGVRAVIAIVKDCTDTKKYFDGIKLVLVALEELRIVDIDDSNDGCCGVVYQDLVELLGVMTARLERENHNQAFGLILEFTSKKFHNCLKDMLADIYETMRPLCSKNPKHLKIIETKLAEIKEKWRQIYSFNHNGSELIDLESDD
jgi:hypothetical protein